MCAACICFLQRLHECPYMMVLQDARLQCRCQEFDEFHVVLVDLYGLIGNNKLGKVSSAPGWFFFEEGVGGQPEGTRHTAHAVSS